MQRGDDPVHAEDLRRRLVDRVRQVLRQVAEHPRTVTDPPVGCSSPAIRRNRVVLPLPLGATRPVRPPGTEKDRSSRTGLSSGQEKDRAELTTYASDMIDLEGLRTPGAHCGARREKRG
ncbi:hypothetical protein GCM10027605_30760 [Micromonospora zhanjiangensis]